MSISGRQNAVQRNKNSDLQNPLSLATKKGLTKYRHTSVGVSYDNPRALFAYINSRLASHRYIVLL